MTNSEPMMEVVVEFFYYIFLARKSTLIEIVENLNTKIEKDETMTANEMLGIINESLLKNNAPFTLPDVTVCGDYIEFRRRKDHKIFDCRCEYFWTPEGEKEVGFISTDTKSSRITFFD